ncbi:PAQR family membrane homeostasis protein TrhA [Halovulum dunhuangense]
MSDYPAYSRAERLSDAAIHVAGVAAGMVGAGVIVALALRWSDSPWVWLGAGVYALCLVAMLLASALYHLTPVEHWRGLLQRLDHSAIYVKIAGTYTPFTALAGTGPGLLASLWGAALLGTAIRMLAPGRFVWLALGLYLGMGWAGVVAGGDLIAALEPRTVTLMVAGGLLYTGGMLFFLWERLPFHNTIWHGFVLVATAIFYAALLVELSDERAPASALADQPDLAREAVLAPL